MRDKDLYATILGITAPWAVRDVDLRAEAQEVEVFIEYPSKEVRDIVLATGMVSGMETSYARLERVMAASA